MGSVLRDLYRKDMEAFMSKSHDNYKNVIGTHNDLKFGIYKRFIVDQVFQKSRSIEIEDAYAWIYWLDLVDRGEIYFGSIHVGIGPSPDKEENKNNEKLKAIHHTFDAECYSGNYGHDGYLSLISDNFTLRNYVVLLEEHSEYMTGVKGENILLCKGAHFPLEIGYYDAYRALETILGSHYLARWPYGHEYIYLFAYRRK